MILQTSVINSQYCKTFINYLPSSAGSVKKDILVLWLEFIHANTTQKYRLRGDLLLYVFVGVINMCRTGSSSSASIFTVTSFSLIFLITKTRIKLPDCKTMDRQGDESQY